MRARLTYQDWQELLEGEFFSGRLAGRSYFFDLDEERLLALSESRGDPRGLGSLVDAGRTYLGTESAGIFESPTLKRRVFEWKSRFDQHRADVGTENEARHPDPGPPPVLPVLLMTVAAARRMRRSEKAAANNYYQRFRELVSLPGSGTPRGFEKLSRWWRYLNDWVAHQGQSPRTDVGRVLVPHEPKLRHVGYPISQACWRDSDTAKVVERMRTLVNEEFSDIGDEELITYARQAASVAGLTEAAVGFIMDVENTDAICRLLREAVYVELAACRTTVIRLGLYLQPVPLTLALVADRPPSWPSALELVDDDGKRLRLEALPDDESTYLSQGLRVDADLLLHGVEFRYGNARVVFDPDESYALERHFLGGFVQSRRPQGDRIALLVPADSPVLKYATGTETIAGDGIPPGWLGIFEVSPTVLGTPETAQSDSSPLRLSGGLRPGPARNMYLTVGLPCVNTSSGLIIHDEAGGVTHVPSSAEGQLKLPQLEPGTYELVADECSATIRVVEGLAGNAPPGELLWWTLDDIKLSGALVCPPPAPQREVPLSSHATERVVLGATVGAIVRPPSQRPPAWVRRAGLWLQEFAFEPPFDPVFVISRFVAIPPRVEVENEIPVDWPTSHVFMPASSEWAEAILEAVEAVGREMDADMLAGYRETANAILSGGA